MRGGTASDVPNCGFREVNNARATGVRHRRSGEWGEATRLRIWHRHVGACGHVGDSTAGFAAVLWRHSIAPDAVQLKDRGRHGCGAGIAALPGVSVTTTRRWVVLATVDLTFHFERGPTRRVVEAAPLARAGAHWSSAYVTRGIPLPRRIVADTSRGSTLLARSDRAKGDRRPGRSHPGVQPRSVAASPRYYDIIILRPNLIGVRDRTDDAGGERVFAASHVG